MRSISSPILVNFGPLFREHKFLIADISHIFCQSATKFGMVRANGHWFPEFGEPRAYIFG